MLEATGSGLSTLAVPLIVKVIYFYHALFGSLVCFQVESHAPERLIISLSLAHALQSYLIRRRVTLRVELRW